MSLRVSLVVLAGLLIAGPGAAQWSKPLHPSEQPIEPQVRVGELSPEDVIVLDDQLWTSELADEPQIKLEDAAAKLESGKLKQAAKDIRKAAAHIQIAAARSDGKVKASLIDSQKELLVLAERLQKNQIVDTTVLGPPFARAMRALAEHHIHKAEVHWLAGKGKRAGYDLKAADLDLGHALKWSNEENEARSENTVYEASLEADHLIREQPVNGEEVTRVLTDTHERIEELGNLIPSGE